MTDTLQQMKEVNNYSGPLIVKEEFEKVLMNMKDEKATEMNGIMTELLKNLIE